MAAHLPETLSPDSVDTLAELSAILSRLRPAPDPAPTLSGLAGDGAGAGAVTGTTPQPSAAATTAAAATATTSASWQGFALKDVPTATDALKHKLQRARARVRELPDMARSVAEQEAEAAELERRIAAQRAALRALREVGLRFAAAAGAETDVQMQG